MKLLDTNILIRFLLEDHPQQSPAAKKLLNSDEELLLTDVALAEIIWLLTSFYKLSKKEVYEKISPILNFSNIKCNKHVLLLALNLYKKLNIDYIDAYMAAYTVENELEGIYSYDKDLDKVGIIKRLEP